MRVDEIIMAGLSFTIGMIIGYYLIEHPLSILINGMVMIITLCGLELIFGGFK